MKRIVAFVSVLTILAAVPAAVYFGHKDRGLRQKYQEIDLGMSRAQVDGILGPPDTTHLDSWGKERVCWTDWGQTISLRYTADETIQTKEFIESSWSLWNWLRGVSQLRGY